MKKSEDLSCYPKKSEIVITESPAKFKSRWTAAPGYMFFFLYTIKASGSMAINLVGKSHGDQKW